MDTEQTVHCTLFSSGESVAVTTDADGLPSFPEPITIPPKIGTWYSKVYARIHEAENIKDNIAADDDREVGTELVNLLFPGDKAKNHLKAMFDSPGKIIFDIITSDVNLTRLPWEACVHADWKKFGINARVENKIVVIRTPSGYKEKWTIKDSDQLKILVAGSNPLGSPTPNFFKELEAIKSGLSKVNTRYLLKEINSVSIPELQDVVGKFEPNIVHFVSHGGRATLELEDADGKPIPVSGTDIALALAQGIDSISVFISTACLAMQDDNKRDIKSIGNSTLIKNIPFILGMQLQITDEQVVRFTREFYQSLAIANNIIDAYSHSRNMLFSNRPKSPEWIGPVLFRSYDRYPRVFPSINLKSLVIQYAQDLEPQIIALRSDPKYVDGWNTITNIINQLELTLIDGYRSGKFPLDPLEQVKPWGAIKEQIPPIRALLIDVVDLINQKERIGTSTSTLLDKLSDLRYTLLDFYKTMT